MYLRDIIYSITGHKIIPVDTQNNTIHYDIVTYLKQSLDNIQKNMIFYAKRPNDVSNNTCDDQCLEKAIVEEFNKVSSNLQARWLAGSGYPDIEIVDLSTKKPIGYVEVKATARQNMHSPRDFYVSPGKVISVTSTRSSGGNIQFNIVVSPRLTHYKIREDAPHIMVLVKIYQLRDCKLPKNMSYECKCWKVQKFSLHDLYSLRLKTKIEFNIDYHGIITNCPQL